MKLKSLKICSALSLALFLGSCDVHQWPDTSWIPDDPEMPENPENPDQPDDPEAMTATICLNLEFATGFTVKEYLYDKTSDPVEIAGSGYATYDNTLTEGVMRYIVRLFPLSASGTISDNYLEYEFQRDLDDSGYDCRKDIEIPAGDYQVQAWADLRETSGRDHLHDAADFRNITLLNHVGNSDYRDAFGGTLAFSAIPDMARAGDQEIHLEMRRPLAKYEFVDLSILDILEAMEGGKTRDAADYTVTVSFPYYVTNSYSLYPQSVGSTEGASSAFSGPLKVNGNGEVSLAFDYVFTPLSSSNPVMQVKIALSDKEGNNVAASNIINVPVANDQHTLIRGSVLTPVSDNGGVGINPDFDGDFNIDPNK